MRMVRKRKGSCIFSKYHKTKKRNDMLEANALALQEELRAKHESNMNRCARRTTL